MTDRTGKALVREVSTSVVVPGNRVVRSAEVARVGGRPALSSDAPTIELVTEANIVRAIDVTCSCGQKMRLWCSYEPDGQDRVSVEPAH